MPERDKFSGADNAWRRMGEMENLMTITGILKFEDEVSYDELCKRLEERLLRFDRFRQKVHGRKRNIRRPDWETVEDFDIHNHVYEVNLPEPQGQAEFEEFVGKLMSRPMDERRPLWEAYLLQEAGEDGGSALAIRLDHCIGDGFALMYVMYGLVDNPQDIEFPISGISTPPRPDLEPEADGSLSDETAAESTDADAKATESAEPAEVGATDGGTATADTSSSAGATSDSDDDRTDPRDEALSSGPLGMLGTAAKGVKTGYDLLTMDEDPDTSLMGELGASKTAAWTRDIDLDRVKKIGKAYDLTVNDVLLAAAAGALRRLLENRGEDVDDVELRCTIPVNLKPMEERDESLGNYFGLVWVPVPVGTPDIEDRIDIIHDRMDARKAGIEAYFMYQLINVGGLVPEVAQDLVMKLFENKATGIVTNVPGPVDSVEFAGSEISDIIFWVPQGNGQGLGISLISYNGGVRVGIAGDENILPEPHDLTETFEEEVDALFEELDGDTA